MNVPAVLVVVPPIIKVLVFPSNVPAVRVHAPVKVWVNPAPRSRVLPGPFKVKPAPPIFPVNNAVPPDFVIETGPVVVKPAILCATLPLIVIGEAFAVNNPLLIKFPPNVNPQLFADVVFKIAELLMLSVALIVLAPPSETVPAVLAMMTPPVPVQVAGNSAPVT